MEGAVSRVRPVVMTALMAALGLLPAALSHAVGAETARRGLAFGMRVLAVDPRVVGQALLPAGTSGRQECLPYR